MRYITPSLMILLVCLSALSSQACKSLQSQRFVINQATIQNTTDSTLHDVKVLQQPTNAVGSTNFLLPNRAFNVGFDGRDMMADYSIITWTDDSGRFHKQKIELPKNTEGDTQAKNLIYAIYPDNTVTIRLNPSE